MSYHKLGINCTPLTIALTDNNKYIDVNNNIYFNTNSHFFHNEYPGNDEFLNYVITQQPVYEKIERVINEAPNSLKNCHNCSTSIRNRNHGK